MSNFIYHLKFDIAQKLPTKYYNIQFYLSHLKFL